MLIEINCKQCGISFKRRKSDIERNRKRGRPSFCTSKCWQEDNALTHHFLVNCAQCDKEVSKTKCEERKAKTGKLFCSQSCAAVYSNSHRVRPRRKHMLSKEERKIIQDAQQAQRYLAGEVKGRKTLRKWLIKLNGNKCFNERCSVSSVWLENDLTLIVDHIDGNASNNLPCNLRLLCPNCNSQTPTFGGRNKGFGRGARGLSLG